MTDNFNELLAQTDPNTIAAMMTGKILLDEELRLIESDPVAAAELHMESKQDFSTGFVLGVMRALEAVRDASRRGALG